jgi:hypothetical protein
MTDFEQVPKPEQIFNAGRILGHVMQYPHGENTRTHSHQPCGSRPQSDTEILRKCVRGEGILPRLK